MGLGKHIINSSPPVLALSQRKFRPSVGYAELAGRNLTEILGDVQKLLEHCPSRCERSCESCLRQPEAVLNVFRLLHPFTAQKRGITARYNYAGSQKLHAGAPTRTRPVVRRPRWPARQPITDVAGGRRSETADSPLRTIGIIIGIDAVAEIVLRKLLEHRRCARPLDAKVLCKLPIVFRQFTLLHAAVSRPTPCRTSFVDDAQIKSAFMPPAGRTWSFPPARAFKSVLFPTPEWPRKQTVAFSGRARTRSRRSASLSSGGRTSGAFAWRKGLA